MGYRKPPLAVFIDTVKRYDKRVGLRKLYKDYEVTMELRPNFRKMWDKIAEEIADAKKNQAPEPEKPPEEETEAKSE